MKPVLLPQTVFLLSGEADKILKAYSTQSPEANRGAFLDVKGNIVAVYWLCRLSADGVLISVSEAAKALFTTHLNKYLPLFDVELLPSEYKVYLREKGAGSMDDGDYVITFDDYEVLFSKSDIEPASFEEALSFRLNVGLPLQDIDYGQEMLLNVFPQGWHDLEKGCYLGQEIIARVHYRSKPPLKLAVCEGEGDPPAEATSVLKTDQNRWKGFLFGSNR